MWNYYLMSCKAAFDVELLHLWQLVMTRRNSGRGVYHRVMRGNPAESGQARLSLPRRRRSTPPEPAQSVNSSSLNLPAAVVDHEQLAVEVLRKRGNLQRPPGLGGGVQPCSTSCSTSKPPASFGASDAIMPPKSPKT